MTWTMAITIISYPVLAVPLAIVSGMLRRISAGYPEAGPSSGEGRSPTMREKDHIASVKSAHHAV